MIFLNTKYNYFLLLEEYQKPFKLQFFNAEKRRVLSSLFINSHHLGTFFKKI